MLIFDFRIEMWDMRCGMWDVGEGFWTVGAALLPIPDVWRTVSLQNRYPIWSLKTADDCLKVLILCTLHRRFSWKKKAVSLNFFSSFDINLNKAAYKEGFRIYLSFNEWYSKLDTWNLGKVFFQFQIDPIRPYPVSSFSASGGPVSFIKKQKLI